MKCLRLTVERERLGWSKQQLAQKARVSPVYISQAESGRRVPYPKELVRIAVALGWTGDPESLVDEDVLGDVSA